MSTTAWFDMAAFRSTTEEQGLHSCGPKREPLSVSTSCGQGNRLISFIKLRECREGEQLLASQAGPLHSMLQYVNNTHVSKGIAYFNRKFKPSQVIRDYAN